ncbi:MAG: methyl-accepting chemotaxis protein [Thermosynechococcus sp. Uc]|uniref:methyl-accepting chemotaxis protein n=1 Tax=Thermosynechococcus sp. Uc TaxID=3034853 RepID=UPI00259D709A|nr:methyl-accepting chemotaxis protein [Thermosynechococcus sp. Uc]MDM7327562.1 methyl-accepting chemotaxis protein [Thermosynechococcus sp. Uc]
MTTAKPPIDLPPLPPSVLNYQVEPPTESAADTRALKTSGSPPAGSQPPKKRGSLRRKITLGAIAIATVPLLITGSVAILSLRQVLIRQLLQTQAEQARVIGIQFNNYLKERLGNAELEAYQLQLRFLGDIQQRNVNVAALSSLIEKIVESSSNYDSAAVIANDGRGTILGQSNLNNPLPNNVLQRQEYFQLAVKTKQSVLTLEPALSLPEKPLSLFVATPILDAKTKRVIAVLRLRISAANLRGFLQNTTPQNLARNFYLVNQQGRIVVASEAEAEGKPLEAVLPQLGVQDVGRRWQQLNNRPVVVAAQALSAPFKSLVLAVDESTILQPVQTITWVMVLCGCAFVFLLAGIAVFFSRRQVQPLLRLIQAVEEISAGNFDIYLPVQGNDELAILSQTVNQMVDQLQASLSQIQVDAQEAALLRDAFLRLSEKSQRQEVLAEAVTVGRELLACDRVIFYEFDENFVGRVVAESVAEGWPKALDRVIDDPCFRQNWVEAYRRGRIQATADIFQAGLTECHLNQLKPLQVRANLVVPVRVGDSLLGLLIAHQCAGPRQWQPTQIDNFSLLATQLGVTLERQVFLQEAIRAQQKAQQLAQQQKERTDRIQQQLIQFLDEAEAAAQGDLTVRADITADEVGTVADIFNALIEGLRDLVLRVKATTEGVSSALLAEDQRMQGLVKEAFRQGKKVERLLESVEEMVTSIQGVAKGAQAAAEVAREASDRALKGGQSMDKTVQSILQLRETIAEAAKKVKRLGEASQQISRVISLINQIALQTNLLAINASIEAARAGEEGRGFAVVAEEVGELAARSAAATREIEQVVETIQQETQAVVSAMETGTAQVVEGTRLVEEAKDNLQKIVAESQRIDDLVGSISEATISQTRTSEVIGVLMREVAKVWTELSGTVNQISESLQATAHAAQQLQESVNVFKVSTEEQ